MHKIGKVLKFFPVIFFPLLVFSPKLFAAQDTFLRITLTSSAVQTSEPGRIITASFLVQNQTSSQQQLSEELILPEGWQAITPAGVSYFTLNPRDQQLRLVSFLIPANCPADTYTVGYVVKRRTDQRAFLREDFQVAVLPLSQLSLLVEEKPDFVIAGNPYTVKLLLANKGNAELKLAVSIDSFPKLELSIEPQEFAVEPNGSIELLIKAKTDKKLARSVNNILKIKISSPDGKTQLEQTVVVKIISKITGKLDPYFRLPAQYRFIALNDKAPGKPHTNRFQHEFSGSGDLNEKGTKRMDFLFRGPDLREIGPYGQEDQYYLSYYSPLMDLHLGDRSYSLSPLTEQYRYARGLEGDFRAGNFGTGTFYSKDRWQDPKEKRKAGYFSYSFNKAFTIRSNFIDRITHAYDYDDRIYTAQALFNPGKYMNLNMEYGRNDSRRQGADFKDSGYYVKMDGQIDLDGDPRLPRYIRYVFEDIHAEPNFYGYYNDMDSKSASVDFPIYKKLKGNLYYRTYKDNLDLNPAETIANREQYYKGGLQQPFGSNITFSLDYEGYQKKDKLSPPDFNYGENVFTFGFGWTKLFGIFNFQGFFERGKMHNKLLNIHKNIQRERGYLNFNPTQKTTVSLYTTIGNDRFSDLPKKSKIFGCEFIWRIFQRFSWALSFEKTMYVFEGAKELNKAISRINYELPNRHQLAITAYWSRLKTGGDEERSFYLSYVIPWDVPVGKKKGIGVLRGRVFDSEKKGNPSIANVILMVGDATAVSDDNGEFIFPALPVGEHSLWVDKRSVGVDRVTVQKSPLTVQIKEAKTTRQDIGIVTSARVFGRLAAFDFKEEKPQSSEQTDIEKRIAEEEAGKAKEEELFEIEGLAGVLIEINNGEEFFQQITDNKGRFSFDGIRPGSWKVLVNEADIPSEYSLPQKEFEVEVRPGEEKEIFVKAQPRIRRIEIIEKEELKLEKRPSKKKGLFDLFRR